MNNISLEKQNRYHAKYKSMTKRIKSLILENAALCDEVAKTQETIIIVKEERKFLLRKLIDFQNVTDMMYPHYVKNDYNNSTNGANSRLKKRRSFEDSGKSNT